MPRISPLDIDATPAETRIAYNHHKMEYNSRITNMKATLGHSFNSFKAYFDPTKLPMVMSTGISFRLFLKNRPTLVRYFSSSVESSKFIMALKDKIAFIAGAAHGQGRATANVFKKSSTKHT